MATVPLADAARLLGKPERTVRRAAKGRLPATRTAEGWLVEINASDLGQVAQITDRADGHSNGHVTATLSATGGQMAEVPVSYLRDLQARAETAAFWQGRSTVLEARVQQLEGQLALPEPTSPKRPISSDSDGLPVETT